MIVYIELKLTYYITYLPATNTVKAIATFIFDYCSKLGIQATSKVNIYV